MRHGSVTHENQRAKIPQLGGEQNDVKISIRIDVEPFYHQIIEHRFVETAIAYHSAAHKTSSDAMKSCLNIRETEANPTIQRSAPRESRETTEKSKCVEIRADIPSISTDLKS